MKKNAARAASKRYSCRNCGQDDFKRWMDVVKHLRKCKGPMAERDGKGAAEKNGAGMVDALSEISRQIGTLKEGIDALIKRLL